MRINNVYPVRIRPRIIAEADPVTTDIFPVPVQAGDFELGNLDWKSYSDDRDPKLTTGVDPDPQMQTIGSFTIPVDNTLRGVRSDEVSTNSTDQFIFDRRFTVTAARRYSILAFNDFYILINPGTYDRNIYTLEAIVEKAAADLARFKTFEGKEVRFRDAQAERLGRLSEYDGLVIRSVDTYMSLIQTQLDGDQIFQALAYIKWEDGDGNEVSFPNIGGNIAPSTTGSILDVLENGPDVMVSVDPETSVNFVGGTLNTQFRLINQRIYPARNNENLTQFRLLSPATPEEVQTYMLEPRSEFTRGSEILIGRIEPISSNDVQFLDGNWHFDNKIYQLRSASSLSKEGRLLVELRRDI